MSDRTKQRRARRASFIATDDPSELAPPRLPQGADVGWAVSELFEGRFGGGVYLGELHGASDTDDVASIVARQFGLDWICG